MRNFFSALATPSLKVSENTHWTLIFSTNRKSQQPKGPQLMRGSRDFWWGWGEAIRNPGSSVTIKALTLFFFVLNLFNRSPMCFFFKESRNFSRFKMGSNIFDGVQLFTGGGGVQLLFPYRGLLFYWGIQTPCHLSLDQPMQLQWEIVYFQLEQKIQEA